MHQKIKAGASNDESLLDATAQLESISVDLQAVSAVLLDMARPGGEFEFDRSSLRAIVLLIDGIEKRINHASETSFQAYRIAGDLAVAAR